MKAFLYMYVYNFCIILIVPMSQKEEMMLMRAKDV